MITRALVFLAVLALVPALVAQEPDVREDQLTPALLPTPEGDAFQVVVGPKGLALEDFITLWTEATGQKFTFRENDFRGKGRVHLSGIVRVPKDEVDFLFQSILAHHGFALIPSGPGSANLWSVEPVDSSRVLKQRAPFVPREKLSEAARQPARVFMTSFTLTQAEVSSIRGAVTQLLSNRAAEFAQEIQSSNSLVVVGFGPTLAAMDRLITAIDRPLPDAIKKAQEARRPGARGK